MENKKNNIFENIDSSINFNEYDIGSLIKDSSKDMLKKTNIPKVDIKNTEEDIDNEKNYDEYFNDIELENDINNEKIDISDIEDLNIDDIEIENVNIEEPDNIGTINDIKTEDDLDFEIPSLEDIEDFMSSSKDDIETFEDIEYTSSEDDNSDIEESLQAIDNIIHSSEEIDSLENDIFENMDNEKDLNIKHDTSGFFDEETDIINLPEVTDDIIDMPGKNYEEDSELLEEIVNADLEKNEEDFEKLQEGLDEINKISVQNNYSESEKPLDKEVIEISGSDLDLVTGYSNVEKSFEENEAIISDDIISVDESILDEFDDIINESNDNNIVINKKDDDEHIVIGDEIIEDLDNMLIGADEEDIVINKKNDDEHIVIGDEIIEDLDNMLIGADEEDIVINKKDDDEHIVIGDEIIEDLDNMLIGADEEDIVINKKNDDEHIVIGDEIIEDLDNMLIGADEEDIVINKKDDDEHIVIGDEIIEDLDNMLIGADEEDIVENVNKDIIIDENTLKELEDIIEPNSNIKEENILPEAARRKKSSSKKSKKEHKNIMADFEPEELKQKNLEDIDLNEKALNIISQANDNIDISDFSLEDSDDFNDIKKIIVEEDDFDGEINQEDLDNALRYYESEESFSIGSSGSDNRLSQEESENFKKLFLYFENVLKNIPTDKVIDFSKSEYYDVYSSLLRKFTK